VTVLSAVARDESCLFADCSLFDLTLALPPNPAGNNQGCDTPQRYILDLQPQRYILDPQPQTPHLKPHTSNPTPHTPHLKPHTSNPTPQTPRHESHT